MSEEVNNDRRRFLRNSAITIAAAEFAMMAVRNLEQPGSGGVTGLLGSRFLRVWDADLS